MDATGKFWSSHPALFTSCDCLLEYGCKSPYCLVSMASPTGFCKLFSMADGVLGK